MKPPNEPQRPDLGSLLGLFPTAEDLSSFDFVEGAEVPAPYHDLLVHEHHMTVTVERFHGDLVDVRILDRRQDADAYSRKILLALQKTGKVVQYGIMRIRLDYCSEPVRAAIVAGGTPLGRILIQNDVLRRIEPTAFVRVIPGLALMQCFAIATPTPTYGRLATIHCNEKPAVELLEIVSPC